MKTKSLLVAFMTTILLVGCIPSVWPLLTEKEFRPPSQKFYEASSKA